MITARKSRDRSILRSMTPDGQDPHAAVQAAATSVSRWVIAVAVAAAAGAALVAPDGVSASITVSIAAIGFVAGLPHGAVDHVLVSRLGGRSLVAVTTLYAATAGLAWVLLFWAGPIALGAVVALSVVHFGLGELEVHRQAGWHPGRGLSVVVAFAGTGALLLPLARSGEVLGDVAAALSPGVAATIGAGEFRAGLAVLWAACGCIALVAALRAGRTMIAVDIVLIGALGAFVPPLVAFAVWFGGWHSVRHAGRLLAVEPDCAALVAAGRTGAAVRHLAWLAVLPSAAALTVVVALVVVVAATPDQTAATAETLRILLALTVPHMVVVGWLDHRDGRRTATAGVPRTAGA